MHARFCQLSVVPRRNAGLGEYCCWFPAYFIMVVEECWYLVDLYNGIRDGSIEVPSTSSRPFEFPETFKEQPFSAVVASKQLGQFQPCNLAAKLGEVTSFGTYLKFMVEQPRDCDTVANRTPMRTIEVLMEAEES